MTEFGSKMARGAAWMVGLKLLERGIGVVSTLVLARLLVPADFGLVAMAMAVVALVEIAGHFGFDIALIRQQDAARAHYDSAWTLQAGYGALAGVMIALLSWPTAAYFEEPRLTPVMWVLAVVAAVQGLENIGTVDFRKEFRYHKDFQFMLAKKLLSFAVTISAALAYPSYWALIAGMATSRVAGVGLSYLMHPFRPRWDTSRVRELMGFSSWIVLLRLVDYVRDRGPDFLIGRTLGATSLGQYRVGLEMATLPTSELLYPVMRAVFPGYAAVAKDRRRLADTFLIVQGIIITLTLPAGAAIVLLADPIVNLLLGAKWTEVIPLVQVLGIYGALAVFQLTNVSIFHVLGVPQQATWLKAAEAALILSTIAGLLAMRQGMVEVAWGMVAVQALMVPVGMHLIAHLLDIGVIDRLRVVWRPLAATGLMALTIWGVMLFIPGGGTAPRAALQLACVLPPAAVMLMAGYWTLWSAAGYPDGPESRLLALVRSRFQRQDSRTEER
jgi:lipopolysaccharide exporter